MAHILLPTDFGHHALNACAYALDLLGSEGNVFTLVHSYVDPVAGYAEVVEMGSAFYTASVEGLAHFTERFRGLPGGADAQVYTAVEYGPLPAALRSLCDKKPVELIVMGTQGAGGFRIFGSNAAAVAKSSAVPVLVVPKDAQYQGLRHLLLADDLQGMDPRSMQVLLKLAQRTGAHITIAHVLRDEAVRTAEKAHAAGVDVELELWPDSVHGFQLAAFLPESQRALAQIVAFVAARTGWLPPRPAAGLVPPEALRSTG